MFYINRDRKIINWKFSNGKSIVLTIGKVLKDDYNNDPFKLFQKHVEWKIQEAFKIC